VVCHLAQIPFFLTLKKVDIPEESKSKENVQMTQKKRRIFTEEQKAEAVRIVSQSGKPVHQAAQELGLTAFSRCH
jgi:transposase